MQNNIIFDLDGTISDPSQGILNSINYILGIFGRPLLAEELLYKYIGPPLQSSFPELLQTQDEAVISRASDLFRQNMLCSGYAENKLYPGIKDLLANLVNEDYRLFIVTNIFQSVLEKIVDNFAIRGFFTELISSNGTSGKSRVKDELIRKYELTKEATIAVGDRESDVAAAADNGIKSVLVLWGFASADEKQSSKCTFKARSLTELQTLLKQNQMS